MRYRIEPVDGQGFVILDQEGPELPGDLDTVRLMGTILFAGEVLVITLAEDEGCVDGRVRIGHGPPKREVIEADFVLEQV
jgi:hypothetical protein